MKNNKNVPEMRFEGFTEYWEQRKVREVTDRYDNLRIPVAASLRVAGTTPYYGANGIQDYVEGYTHDGEFILVAEDGANDLKNYPVKCVKGRIWVNNHAHVLQGKCACADNQFLAYAISQADIESLLVGGGRAKLNAETLMDIELLLPSKDEQIQIGHYLARLDNLITLHQDKYEKLLDFKKSMMYKLFPKEGETTPELRFDGFNGEWEKVKLGTVLKQRIEPQKISDEAPLLSFSYAEGVINPEDKKSNKRDFIMLDKYNKIFSRTEKNDIIYNPANVIHGAIHRNKLGTGVVSPIYKIFICQDVNAKYIGERVRTPDFIKEIKKYIEGSVTKLRTLSADQFLDMIIEIPSSPEEQEKIGDYFVNLDKIIDLQEQKIKKLKNIKSSLLDKMFV